ncbi:ABC transporter ATP-binding protein [Puia sp. P3]|uniref:ABC transporter ATP-binding protein n=1 Tax=Puia sp. P3 TaxID=3423952 RepID=UPI003D67D5BC
MLQAIAGAIALSEGSIDYQTPAAADTATARAISPEQVFRLLSLAAPYLEVIEEMTVTEFLHFHASFKSFITGITVEEIISRVGLRPAADKQIRFYSSGMKQRVRLAQAIFSDAPLLLLDEPCTNLDVDGIALYRGLVHEYGKSRLVVVSSNDPRGV